MHNAFWKISAARLIRVCDNLKVYGVTKTLTGLLKALIYKFLPATTDEEMLQILRKRVKKSDACLTEIIQSEEVQDALDVEGAKEVEKLNEHEIAEKEADRTIREEIKALRIKVANAKGGLGGSSSSDEPPPPKKEGKTRP